MGFYANNVLPRFIDLAMKNPEATRLRAEWLPRASGDVLEVGVRRVYGVNPSIELQRMARSRLAANRIDHGRAHDPAKIGRLYALEPNSGMIRIAEGHPKRMIFDIQFLDLPGERIPLADGSVDTVVSTFTLCTITGVDEAMRGIARVLKRDGRLIFIENTVSPHKSVRRWQEFWAPAHHRVFAGSI